MIKGGFQGLDISGVDLTAQSPTLPGAYEACAAGNGKTILVLTADGAVQCSFKKVSTTFVLAGITGDGKILSITVTSTDGITVSESEPSEGSALKPSAEPITIGSGGGNKMTLTQDGYAVLEVSSDTTTTSFIAIAAEGMMVCRLPSGTAGPITQTVFLKKGMSIYSNGTGDGITAKFYPLVPVE